MKHKILDIPNERSSHTIPTPRGGGLAIVITWYVGISIIYFVGSLDKGLYFALLSGCILAIVSILDDLFDIKPYIRLTFQILSAVLAYLFLGGLLPFNILGFDLSSKMLLFIFVILGILWFINIYNFLDGIDGYASVEAIIVSIVLYFFSGNIITLILIASVSGFLIWNWPKAKIFMGDIGSTQLGFILVVLGVYLHNQTHLSIIHWIMLSSLFWFDATLTLYRRWRNKETLTKAHKKHAYQRIVQSGFSHNKTLLVSILINMVIIGFVYLSQVYSILLIPLFIINLLFLYFITRLIDNRLPFGKS